MFVFLIIASTLSLFLVLKYKKEWIKKMKPIPIRDSAQMASLHQHGGLKVNELVKLFSNYSQASIYRHSKGTLVRQIFWISVDLIGGDHPKLQNKTDVQ